MTDTTKTEALRLADLADKEQTETVRRDVLMHNIAAELRRLSAVEAERDRLAAECEALRADAERYRWLRSSEDATLEDLQWQLVRDYGDEYLDAKIDAAMGGKE
jgi:hypothetical protein